MTCIYVQSLNCTRNLIGSQCIVASGIARHDHDDVSQTRAEQRRSALSVTARVLTAAGPRTPSCSSPKSNRGVIRANTRRMVTSLPTRRQIWRSRRMWKAHCCDLGICLFIVSSESNRTPRSRMTSEGLIVVYPYRQ